MARDLQLEPNTVEGEQLLTTLLQCLARSLLREIMLFYFKFTFGKAANCLATLSLDIDNMKLGSNHKLNTRSRRIDPHLGEPSPCSISFGPAALRYKSAPLSVVNVHPISMPSKDYTMQIQKGVTMTIRTDSSDDEPTCVSFWIIFCLRSGSD